MRWIAIVAVVGGCYMSHEGETGEALTPPTVCADDDGDGYCAPVDCNDDDPSVYRGAVEPCHPYWLDADCDGFTSCNDLDCLASGLCP